MRSSTRPAIPEGRGLGDRFNKGEIISRDESDRLGRLLREEVATIGIAGPHGYGKTSVMRQAVEDARVGVWFPCLPSENCTEREFTFALFERLCRDVTEKMEKRYGGLRISGHIWQGSLRLVAALLFASLAVAVAWALYWDLPFGLSGPTLPNPVLLPLVGLLLIIVLSVLSLNFLGLIPLAVLPGLRRSDLSPSANGASRFTRLDRLEDLYLHSKKLLETLRYAESIESSRGIDIGPMQGVKVSGQVARQLERRPLSYVGILDRFRLYTKSVRRDFEHMVVAIDEIDKLEPEEARDFLRKISPLFDAPGVSFIVSVPDQDLDSFELRALATRDNVASCLGQVIKMKPLTLDNCRELLAERGVACQLKVLPELLAVLSAGSPRDLVRSARDTFSEFVVRYPPDKNTRTRNQISWAKKKENPDGNFPLSEENRRWASIPGSHVKAMATLVLERAARDVCGAATRSLDRMTEPPDHLKNTVRSNLTVTSAEDLERLYIDGTQWLDDKVIGPLKTLLPGDDEWAKASEERIKAIEKRYRNISDAMDLFKRLRTKLATLSLAAKNLDSLLSEIASSPPTTSASASQELFEILTLNKDSPTDALDRLQKLPLRLNWREPEPSRTTDYRLPSDVVSLGTDIGSSLGQPPPQ